MLNIFDYYAMRIKEGMLSKRERHIVLFLFSPLTFQLLRKNEHADSRDCEDQSASNPPVCMGIASQSPFYSHDRRSQAGQNAYQGDRERQQTTGAAAEHLDGRCRHREKEKRGEKRQYDVALDERHDLLRSFYVRLAGCFVPPAA
jgi:hypothetical protein